MTGPSSDLTADFSKFAAELDTWTGKAGPITNAVVDEAAAMLLGAARSSAVRVTGDFAKSFKRDRAGAGRKGNYSRRVYSTDPGGMAIEYGTAHQPPQPALSIHADRAAAAIESALMELIPGFGR